MSTHLNTFTFTATRPTDFKTANHTCREVVTPFGYSKILNEKNEVAVMISRGYGAGWSTWAESDILRHVIFDSRIIRYKFLGEYAEHNYESFMKNIVGFAEDIIPYEGGFPALMVQFIPEGTQFRINEYDGSESIEIFDPKNFETA